MGLRESFLIPSSAIKENFDNLIVSKARLIDYMLSFGIDLFFKTILGHYRSFLNRNGTSALPLTNAEPALERPNVERSLLAL